MFQCITSRKFSLNVVYASLMNRALNFYCLVGYVNYVITASNFSSKQEAVLPHYFPSAPVECTGKYHKCGQRGIVK